MLTTWSFLPPTVKSFQMGWHYYNFDSFRNKLHPLKSSTFSKEKNISAHLQEQKKGLFSQHSIPFYVESKKK